jgi:Ca2+-binding EF-hand superfamily protein
MLWHALNTYTGTIDAAGIKRLLRTAANKVIGDCSQARYPALARLTNPKENPLFAVCLGRMRAGAAVPIRAFLQAVCPCASGEQIDCFEKFDLESWHKEKRFVEAVGQWSCDSSEFWRKPVMRPKALKDLAAQFKAMDVNGDSRLSVPEICTAELSPEDAKELVCRHDLDGNGSISLKEFVHMQCPDAKRPQGDVEFERALRRHWDNVRESWEVGRCAAPVTSPKVAHMLFISADYDGDGSISLDELAGYVDVNTSRDLMAAYDSNSDGRLSHSEFRSMVGAVAVA